MTSCAVLSKWSDLGLGLTPHSQLTYLRWELGTCIPVDLLGGPNSPLKNQTQIESISIITDYDCEPHHAGYVDLVQFKELRSLSWLGLLRYHDLDAVRRGIAVHGHQMTSLTLGFVDWQRAQQRTGNLVPRVSFNFFAQYALGLHLGGRQVMFPVLEHLSLSTVSFDYYLDEMTAAINTKNLKSLTLRDCIDATGWLEHLSRVKRPIRSLKTLELAVDYETGRKPAEQFILSVGGLIGPIAGLENLYLMLPLDRVFADFIGHIAGNKRLRRVVTHQVKDGARGFIDDPMPWDPDTGFESFLQGEHLIAWGTTTTIDNLVRLSF